MRNAPRDQACVEFCFVRAANTFLGHGIHLTDQDHRDLMADWNCLDERIDRLTDEIEALARADEGCRRGRSYGEVFVRRVLAMGIRDCVLPEHLIRGNDAVLKELAQQRLLPVAGLIDQAEYLVQRQVRSRLIVQLDNITPTGPRNGKFFIPGIRGLAKWCSFMEG